jgi:hypothetical protein
LSAILFAKRIVMSSAKARLTRLLDLADRGPSLRAALAEELIELLLDWPADTPPEMRATIETLLEKAARDLPQQARERLMARLENDPLHPLALHILPPHILNKEFFTAAPARKAAILGRNRAPADKADADTRRGHNEGDGNNEEARLLADFREGAHYARAFAQALALPQVASGEILGDASAWSLAVACKGAHLSRAAFSALALLSIPAGDAADQYERLEIYDRVPPRAAERMLQSWREPSFANAAE